MKQESQTWKIEISDTALKQFSKLDKPIAKKIFKWLEERIYSNANPRLWGKQLKGSDLGDMWRYRIGDYRVLCLIKDNVVTVQIITVGHRKDIYD